MEQPCFTACTQSLTGSGNSIRVSWASLMDFVLACQHPRRCAALSVPLAAPSRGAHFVMRELIERQSWFWHRKI